MTRRGALQLRRGDARDGALLRCCASSAALLFLAGTVLMTVNLARTFAGGRTVEVTPPLPAAASHGEPTPSGDRVMSFLRLHSAIERNTGLLIFGILVVASIGGLVQVLPTTLDEALPHPIGGRRSVSAARARRPRHLHSRIVLDLPFAAGPPAARRGETLRRRIAGSGEFAYDRPFLWGSKRTGPDLLRVGGNYSDAWHRVHMNDPRAVVAASIMPAYPWLAERTRRRERRHPGPAARAANARRSLFRRGRCRSARRARGQDGARRTDRVPAVAWPAPEHGRRRARGALRWRI